MQRIIYIVFLSLALHLLLTAAYPTGAPDLACRDLTPQHGYESSSDPNPYIVAITKSSNGATVNITGPWFKGFLVQARDTAGKVTGQFRLDEDAMLQHLNCENKNGSITHTQSFREFHYTDLHGDMDTSHHNDSDTIMHENEHAGSTHRPGEAVETHHDEHHNVSTEHPDVEDDKDLPTRLVTLDWVSSNSSYDETTFRVTVVQHADRFWADFVGVKVTYHSTATQAAVVSLGLLIWNLITVLFV